MRKPKHTKVTIREASTAKNGHWPKKMILALKRMRLIMKKMFSRSATLCG